MDIAATTRTLHDLPAAPGALPLLGHSLRMPPSRVHLQLERWCADIGPLYTIRVGPQRGLVCADPELMQTALRERPHRWRRFRAIEAVIAEMGSNGLFSVEGDAWRPQRALIMKALASTNFPAYFPAMQAITRRLHARWRQAAQGGRTVEMLHDLKLYTVDITTTLVFGEDPNTIEHSGDAIQAHLAELFPMLMARVNAPFPLWRYLKLPRDIRFDRALAAVHRHVHGLIERGHARLAAHAGGPPANLLEAMLLASRDPASGITSDTVAANVLTLLLAGEDTTANSLAWALYFLAQDAALQDRLHALAVELLGDAAVCAAYEGVRRLDAFEAIATEAMRLKPIAPIILLEPIQDAVLGDVEVRRGTPVFFMLRPAMLDDANFGLAPEFRPERWAAGHEAVQPHDAHAYAQFGAGPRMCPGRHLAGVEQRLVLSMLMRDFRVELAVPPSAIREVMAFAMMPDRMPVRLTARDDAAVDRP